MNRTLRVSARRLIAAAVTLILSAGMVVAVAPAAHAAPSANADLSELSLSVGTLSPAFDAATTNYTAALPSHVGSFEVNALSAHAGAVRTINGSELWSVYVIAMPGETHISIVVTAEDGATTKSYTITATRPASTDAAAHSLRLTSGVLSPAFAPEITSYTAAVSYSTTGVTVAARMVDDRGTSAINGVPNRDTLTIPLNFGPNVINIVTTAEDGVTTKAYSITVSRALSVSSDATLSAINLSTTLSPSFAPATTDYSIALEVDDSSYSLSPIPSSAYATVTINGLPYVPGSPFYIGATTGVHIISIVVTAEDGVVQNTYTITATRPVNTSAAIGWLTLSPGSLSPAFTASETSYTAAVANSTTEIAVYTSPGSSRSTLAVNGVSTPWHTRSDAIPLKVGDNTITAVVTAEDGATTKTYTVTVTRAASSNANLSALALSDGTLSPVFDAATTSYTASVDYLTEEITLAAGVADSTATTTINGQPGASAAVPLTVGENTITIVATAEDGSAVTTTVVVTRQAALAAGLGFDLGFAAGDASAGAPVTVTGANMLPGSVATLTMHSTPIVLATGTVLADGTIVLSTRLPAGVEPGAHRLVFEGIAQDGTPVTRTAWFTVLRNGTIGAVSLTVPVAYTEPAATAAMPVTGADTGPMAAVAAAIVTFGTLMLMLGAALRRRSTAA